MIEQAYPADGIEKAALISRCGRYRYWLQRLWDENRPPLVFIGLNPSTADALVDDPTIRRCIGFARDWGYGGIYMLNLFAYRTRDPAEMIAEKDPFGPENEYWLRNTAELADEPGSEIMVIAAWGNDGVHLNHDKEVVKMFPNLKCLGVNKSGQPKHPLYLPKTTKPIAYSGA